MQIQHESCRLPNMSVAAIYGLPECLEIACEAMQEAKHSSLFLAAPGMSQIGLIAL
jgi:hypothetical protein